jgi:hypothetical protein
MAPSSQSLEPPQYPGRFNFGLELFLKVHLLQAAVFILKLFHARHHGHIHAPVLGTPFVKRRRADAQLAANIWDTYASFNPFD